MTGIGASPVLEALFFRRLYYFCEDRKESGKWSAHTHIHTNLLFVCLVFSFFGVPHGTWALSSQRGTEPLPLAGEVWGLTVVSPGKSNLLLFKSKDIFTVRSNVLERAIP